jgi:hypothetical protein
VRRIETGYIGQTYNSTYQKIKIYVLKTYSKKGYQNNPSLPPEECVGLPARKVRKASKSDTAT